MSSAEIRNKVHEIIDESDDTIIDVVYTMLNAYNAKAVLGYSVEEYNKEIKEGEAEIERGESFSHEEVVAMSKSWTDAKK